MTGRIMTEQGRILITTDNNVEKKSAYEYDFKYSYTELPDVISLDSDSRFTYVNLYTEEDVAVYSFQYNEAADYETFQQACEDYGQLLQSLNGFTYDKEHSELHYENLGEVVDYYLREDYGVAITMVEEASLYYAHIAVFPNSEEFLSDGVLYEDDYVYEDTSEETSAEAYDESYGDTSEETSGDTSGDTYEDTYDLPNYNTYLADRDLEYYDFEQTVNMENGLSFYVYDVIARYPGDGTIAIDLTLDISSYYSDYYLYNGDFMILPVDGEGNILSDAIPITYVTDSLGYEVKMPFLASASSYDYYTFSFSVPSDTMALSIYAANIINEEASGPVYVMDIGFTQ